MFLSGEKLEGERCISAEGLSVKGSSEHSSTYGPKVKGAGPLFSGRGHLLQGSWWMILHRQDSRCPEPSVKFKDPDCSLHKFFQKWSPIVVLKSISS